MVLNSYTKTNLTVGHFTRIYDANFSIPPPSQVSGLWLMFHILEDLASNLSLEKSHHDSAFLHISSVLQGSPTFSAMVKNAWCYTSPSVSLQSMHSDNFTFTEFLQFSSKNDGLSQAVKQAAAPDVYRHAFSLLFGMQYIRTTYLPL